MGYVREYYSVLSSSTIDFRMKMQCSMDNGSCPMTSLSYSKYFCSMSRLFLIVLKHSNRKSAAYSLNDMQPSDAPATPTPSERGPKSYGSSASRSMTSLQLSCSTVRGTSSLSLDWAITTWLSFSIA